MDLRLTAEELAFRDEVRAFIGANLPADIRDRMQQGHPAHKADIVAWQRILNKKGWAAYNWPKEWGGPGWSAVQRMIFLDETQTAPTPNVNPFNITMLGPVLIQFGTPEQKQRFLPRAARATNTSSTARRSGPRPRTWPIGALRWCAPTPTRQSGRWGSRSS